MAAPADDLAPLEWGSAAEFFGPRHDYRESLMLRRFKPALAGRRVLDAGCGAGSLTEKLVRDGYDVTAVDGSEAFVREVERRMPPGASATVFQADLTDLPLPSGHFDGVACGEVLEHLEDDAGALGEICRVLRPGGVVLVTVPANPWRYDWVDLWAGHHRRYTPASLAERLTGAGLVDVDVLPWGFPVTGLYHRLVYKPMLRRRLSRGGDDALAAPQGRKRALMSVLRAVLELDTLFLGWRPGYFGLLATARKPLP